MTNIFVGFHDQRSCNRILKPPGGGTSDIFYSPDFIKPKKIEQVAEIIITPEVKISELEPLAVVPSTNGDTAIKEIENPQEINNRSDTIEETKMQALSISNDNTITTNVEESKSVHVTVTKSKTESVSSLIQQNESVVDSPKKAAVRSPNRVPPGGYSSGLW